MATPYTITRVRFHRGITCGGYQFKVGSAWHFISEDGLAKLWADIEGWELTKDSDAACATCHHCNTTIQASRATTRLGLAYVMEHHRKGTRYDGRYVPRCPVAQAEVDAKFPMPPMR